MNTILNQWINNFYRVGAIGVDERDEFKQRLNVVCEDFEPIIRDLNRSAQFLTPRYRAKWSEFVEQNHRPDGPFASLRDLVYTECPCGCGSKEVCEEQRARVEAHDAAIPF